MDANRMRQPEGMIYWVIGATHEWRFSTTHSKSPILLFIPRARLSPSPSAHSTPSLQICCTISQHNSMSAQIHFLLPHLSFSIERFIRGCFVSFYSNCGNLEKNLVQGCGKYKFPGVIQQHFCISIYKGSRSNCHFLCNINSLETKLDELYFIR